MRDHPAENSVLGIRDDPWHNAQNWLVWFGQWTSAGATEDRSLKVMVFVREACGI